MRYWITLDSIGSRIIRVSSDLSGAMRTFCYVFVLGHLLKSTDFVKFGSILIDESILTRFSTPITIFIVLDLLHPAIYLFALHMMHLFKWKKYKKYEGKEDEKYNENMDKTELVFELNPLEFFGISILPNLLLLIKTFVVLSIVILLLFTIANA